MHKKLHASPGPHGTVVLVFSRLRDCMGGRTIGQQTLVDRLLFALLADALVEEYIVQLVLGTRDPASYGDDLAHWVNFGGSPRGNIALERSTRAHTWLRSKDHVSPEDVQAVLLDTLRLRALMSFVAEVEGVDTDDFLTEFIGRVPAI